MVVRNAVSVYVIADTAPETRHSTIATKYAYKLQHNEKGTDIERITILRLLTETWFHIWFLLCPSLPLNSFIDRCIVPGDVLEAIHRDKNHVPDQQLTTRHILPGYVRRTYESAESRNSV
jgi:hypothetical protein